MKWFWIVTLCAALTACDQSGEDGNGSGCDSNASGCDGNERGGDSDGCDADDDGNAGSGSVGGDEGGNLVKPKDTNAEMPKERRWKPAPGDRMANLKMMQYPRVAVQKMVDTIDHADSDARAKGGALMSLPIHVNHFVDDPDQLTDLVIPVLRRVLIGDVHPKGRGMAALKLAGLAKSVPEAVEPLLKALDREDTREITCQMLGQARPAPKQFVPKLAELLKIEHMGTQVQAAITLSRYGEHAAPATDPLIELVKNNKSQPRWRAIQALGAIGPDAKAALPLLQEQLKAEKRGNIKFALQKAIENISK